MLVLSRKPGEKVLIDGGIVVTVLSVSGPRVRIGLEAPDDVCIRRAELDCWREDGVEPAVDPSSAVAMS